MRHTKDLHQNFSCFFSEVFGGEKMGFGENLSWGKSGFRLMRTPRVFFGAVKLMNLALFPTC